MQHLVDAFWRTVYRLGYPCAQLVWRIGRVPGRGASIAVWHDGRLLCVRESYRRGLGLPGGGLNERENPEAAARRELREEVGLDLPPEAFRRRGPLAYRYAGRAIEDILFEVQLEAPLPPQVDNREIVWAGYLTPAAMLAQPMQRGVALYLQQLGHRSG
jgi:8-oxo-dGTP pyrophosphatase MutT (NUDIX family)